LPTLKKIFLSLIIFDSFWNFFNRFFSQLTTR
jgi:hypothetical protein